MTPKLKLVSPNYDEGQRLSRDLTESSEFKTRLKKEGQEVVLFAVQLCKHVFQTAMFLAVVAAGAWLEHWREAKVPVRDPKPNAQAKTSTRQEPAPKPAKAQKSRAK